MDNIKLAYNGSYISFRRVADGYAEARATMTGRHDVCPMCKEMIRKDATGVVLMVSNQAGVPNRAIHGECFDKCLPEYALRRITEDWEAAQRYADWFGEADSV